MQCFEVGDLVLLINATYNPEIIGHVGTVAQGESHVKGYDKYGRSVSGNYVIVDLADDMNRHGTTLWYLKPEHLIKIKPDELIQEETRETHIC